MKNGSHGDLHITSHRFDEPQALDVVAKSQTAVAIHGRMDQGKDAVWLGGRALALRNAIGTSLQNAAFEAEPNHRLPGLKPEKYATARSPTKECSSNCHDRCAAGLRPTRDCSSPFASPCEMPLPRRSPKGAARILASARKHSPHVIVAAAR